MDIKIDVTLRSPELAYAIIELAEAIKGIDGKATLTKVKDIVCSPATMAEPVPKLPTAPQPIAPALGTIPQTITIPQQVMPINQQPPIQTGQSMQQGLTFAPPVQPLPTAMQVAPMPQTILAQPVPLTVPLQSQTVPVTPPVQPLPMAATPSVQPLPVAATLSAQPVPVAAVNYTMDQLAVAGMSLVEVGRRDAVLQLLNQFGVTKLTDLPKERYGEYATALRQLGAKI
jgi:hypothetical protein